MVYILLLQVFVYLTCASIATWGIYKLAVGNIEGAAFLTVGLLGLGAGALCVAGAARLKCKPRIWVDLDAETITFRHAIGDVLPFAEAEQMGLSTGRLSQSWLVGPRTDMTGRIDPKGSFGYVTGLNARRRDGGRHFLADMLPAPFAQMPDDLMIVDDLRWDDALRFALFMNLRTLWNAGRTTP